MWVHQQLQNLSRTSTKESSSLCRAASTDSSAPWRAPLPKAAPSYSTMAPAPRRALLHERRSWTPTLMQSEHHGELLSSTGSFTFCSSSIHASLQFSRQRFYNINQPSGIRQPCSQLLLFCLLDRRTIRQYSGRVSIDQGEFAKPHQGLPSTAFLLRSGSLLHLHFCNLEKAREAWAGYNASLATYKNDFFHCKGEEKSLWPFCKRYFSFCLHMWHYHQTCLFSVLNLKKGYCFCA